jgi:hypothetical protein
VKPHLSTVRARFDGKEFVVFDRSPELPATFDPLLHYLNTLSISGWKAVRGKFDGWEVSLSLEQQTETPYKTGTAYMIPVLHQIPSPGGRSTTGDQHKKLMDTLQKSGMKDGWEILVGPQQFSIGSETWTISIWAKNYPKT